jgi:hypothetical protein
MLELLDNKFVAVIAILVSILAMLGIGSSYNEARNLDILMQKTGRSVEKYKFIKGTSSNSGSHVMIEIPETYSGDIAVSRESFMKIKSSIDENGELLPGKTLRVRNVVDYGNHILIENDKFTDFDRGLPLLFFPIFLGGWGVFRLFSRR